MASIFISSIVAIVIGILIFLALRKIMLWYWKVDKALAVQKAQLFILLKMAEKQGVAADDLNRALRYSREDGDIDKIKV
jgi:phosphate/sulfate permease